MFLIGLYGVTRELVETPPVTPQSWISSLLRLRGLALPFYLTHQQVLVVVAAGASWCPRLSKDPYNNNN